MNNKIEVKYSNGIIVAGDVRFDLLSHLVDRIADVSGRITKFLENNEQVEIINLFYDGELSCQLCETKYLKFKRACDKHNKRYSWASERKCLNSSKDGKGKFSSVFECYDGIYISQDTKVDAILNYFRRKIDSIVKNFNDLAEYRSLVSLLNVVSGRGLSETVDVDRRIKDIGNKIPKLRDSVDDAIKYIESVEVKHKNLIGDIESKNKEFTKYCDVQKDSIKQNIDAANSTISDNLPNFQSLKESTDAELAKLETIRKRFIEKENEVNSILERINKKASSESRLIPIKSVLIYGISVVFVVISLLYDIGFGIALSVIVSVLLLIHKFVK